MRAAPLVSVLPLLALLVAPAAAQTSAPALSSVIDSSAVIARLAGLPADPDPSLFAVTFASDGSPPLQRVHRTAALRDSLGEVGEAIRGALRSATPTATGTPAFLEVRPGAAASVRLIGALEEVPRLRNVPRIQRVLGRTAADLSRARPFPMERRYQTMILVLIDEEGVPISTTLERSTGDPLADRGVVAAAEEMRFHPARLDGRPVIVRALVPVMLVIPAAAQRTDPPPAFGRQPSWDRNNPGVHRTP